MMLVAYLYAGLLAAIIAGFVVLLIVFAVQEWCDR
jgi:hypothetical protein